MENTNQAPELSTSPTIPPKSNQTIVIILSILVAFALILVAVNFFSWWECQDGKWKRHGMPLSGRPQGVCENKQASKNSQKVPPGSEKDLKETDNMLLENEKTFEANGIEVAIPLSGSEAKSPLKIKGRAKANWFFEGSFPVKLADEKGNIFAENYVSAEPEWMDKEWVDFEGTIEFSAGNSASGFLILEKDNPSGMTVLDDAVSIPLKFSFSETPSEKITKSPHIYSQCGHDPKDDPILGDCAEDCNTANWKVYKNKKYGYSFRYPADYVLTSNCKNMSCVSEQDGGDWVTLSGDLSEKGWPMVEIRHLSTSAYNPPQGVDLISWINEKFPQTEECMPNSANIYFAGKEGHLFKGFNIYYPASPQAYSRREIYYLYQGKLFQIIMLDATEPQARQFYDIWLSTFSAIGE